VFLINTMKKTGSSSFTEQVEDNLSNSAWAWRTISGQISQGGQNICAHWPRCMLFLVQKWVLLLLSMVLCPGFLRSVPRWYQGTPVIVSTKKCHTSFREDPCPQTCPVPAHSSFPLQVTISEVWIYWISTLLGTQLPSAAESSWKTSKGSVT
jgi:hypothetical protein